MKKKEIFFEYNKIFYKDCENQVEMGRFFGDKNHLVFYGSQLEDDSFIVAESDVENASNAIIPDYVESYIKYKIKDYRVTDTQKVNEGFCKNLIGDQIGCLEKKRVVPNFDLDHSDNYFNFCNHNLLGLPMIRFF